jgi:hypothetical protein
VAKLDDKVLPDALPANAQSQKFLIAGPTGYHEKIE